MSTPRIIVIKIGSNSLVDNTGALDAAFLHAVAGQFAALKQSGWQPVLVTSGAVAAGVSILGLSERPAGLPERQALAAIGQVSLAHTWEAALAKHDLVAAQLLLTHDDFSVRKRWLNLSDTMGALFAFGAVPVINENDPVAVEELTVGDNDRLSALVAVQLGAERLVLMTDIDGVYDADPRTNPTAKLVPVIPQITAAVLAAAGGAGARGRGGMRSKIEAAKLAAAAGVTTTICHARSPAAAIRAAAGETVGTTVIGHGNRADARLRWLAVGRKTKGQIQVDAGAAQALATRGRSLLPAGIVAVEGRFDRGDTVAIISPTGDEIGRGLAAMSASELDQIKGRRLDAAAAILGHALPKAAVHRDNLLILMRG